MHESTKKVHFKKIKKEKRERQKQEQGQRKIYETKQAQAITQKPLKHIKKRTEKERHIRNTYTRKREHERQGAKSINKDKQNQS